MQSIAQPVKGIGGISRQISWVYILLGRKLNAQFATVDVLVDVSVHAYPPKVASHHVHCVADTLVALCILEL